MRRASKLINVEDIEQIPEIAANTIAESLTRAEDDDILLSGRMSPLKDVPLLSPPRQRLGTVRETRDTLERSLDLKRMTSEVD